MKKIYSILALGALLALSSCSKDDISTYSEQEAGVRFLATKLTRPRTSWEVLPIALPTRYFMRTIRLSIIPWTIVMSTIFLWL